MEILKTDMTMPAPVPPPPPTRDVPRQTTVMGQPDVVQISRTAREKGAEVEPERQEEQQQQLQLASEKRAVLALDDDKNVVVQVIDEEGKVVRQMPPEEFMKMMNQLKELSKQLFHVEV